MSAEKFDLLANVIKTWRDSINWISVLEYSSEAVLTFHSVKELDQYLYFDLVVKV